MNQNPALVPYTVRVKGAVSVGYPSKFTLYALEVFTPKTDFVLFRYVGIDSLGVLDEDHSGCFI